MEEYEKLGVFYLGRTYDMGSKNTKNEMLLYDSKDLVTHAVCIGMTGSGKTGLCISLIEEAAIDGVPSILIDPKGDLANLLLTFPLLRGEDFLPWINLDDARKKGLSAEEFASQQAETWKKGLADWNQSGERIQRLRDAAEMVIYTPGSSAGIQVSILKSFAVPEIAILNDPDLLRERISTTVTSLLGLVGIEADPVQSKEHILLSTIMDILWRKGQDLDLAVLIQMVQTPPITKIGVLDLESFYPSKDRFNLVMALNNLLASPGFEAWLKGTPLDIGNILYTQNGKPRIAIFSIAHLSDPERMFFVSLLVNQIIGWMRGQPGTTSLRAIVYMDEIFGFLPPVSNPPSKIPMLTMLKQARAYGIAMVLATQNPVDLDYKALSNAGTWFIGRLQTERDKARLLDGLESATATAGGYFKKEEIDKILSSLDSRVFLLNNTHEDAPELFKTRWALSYLRGPLTRDQIKQLMDPHKATIPITESVPARSALPVVDGGGTTSKQAPALPPNISSFFVPVRGRASEGSSLLYQPQIIGAVKINFANAKANIYGSENLVFLTPVTDNAIPVVWDNARAVDIPAADLEKSPASDGLFAQVPPAASLAANYTNWNRDLQNWLYASQKLELFKSPSLKKNSEPGETERDFRVRLQQYAREQRDEMAENLRKKYAAKIATLQERMRRAQQAVDKQAEQAKQAKIKTAISVGSTILGAFTGRKISGSTIGRASTAMRGVSRSIEESKDIDRAEETVEAVQKQLKELQVEFDAELAALEQKINPLTEELETITIKPSKSDIIIQLVALAWVPFWQDGRGNLTEAW